MIITFEQLKNYNFALSDINVIYQKPTYRHLHQSNRLCNGFLYITVGRCLYSFDEGEITLTPNSVIYLPFGSRHRLTVLSDQFEFYRIDFTLKIDGNDAFFSQEPLKITDSASLDCLEAIRNLDETLRFENNSIVKNQHLCALFCALMNPLDASYCSKLTPAIQFIHEHMTEHIDCHELANLCYLSTAQFYNLFRTEYSMTPLAYRNKLLLKRASILLESGEVSVTEAASMLGFESVAYFSRFFKRHKGVPPSQYTKQIF